MDLNLTKNFKYGKNWDLPRPTDPWACMAGCGCDKHTEVRVMYTLNEICWTRSNIL